jgi:Tfp pilus assembly protein PilV
MTIQIASGRGGVPRGVARQLLQRGFALVEVLIGGCILGFAVVSLYSAYAFGFALIRLSQEDVRADQILLEQMETLRVYSWSETAPGSGILPSTFSETNAPDATPGGVVYYGTIAVAPAPVSESYSNTLRQVTITLNWFSAGVRHTRSMSTFVSQNGIESL